MRTIQSGTGTKITRVGLTTDTKSDRSEFVFRPVPCKSMKRNLWRTIRTHTGSSSSRSHKGMNGMTQATLVANMMFATRVACAASVSALTFAQ